MNTTAHAATPTDTNLTTPAITNLIRIAITPSSGVQAVRIAHTQDEVSQLIAPFLAHECDFSIRHLHMPVDPRRISLFCRPGYEIVVALDGEVLVTAHRKDDGKTLDEAKEETPKAHFFGIPAGVNMYDLQGVRVDTTAEGFVLAYNEPSCRDADMLRAFGFAELH